MMTPKERAAVSIQNESETVSSLSTMRTAMQQALDALEYREEFNETTEYDVTAIIALREALAEPNKNGCGATLAAGQYWQFCGETDMGQTAPVLCENCESGGLKLAAQAEHERKYGELAGTHNWTPPNYTDEQWQKLDQEYQDHVAKQKPIGYLDESDLRGLSQGNAVWLHPEDQGRMVSVYAAPVRTKDLTDDEIEAIMVEQGDLRTTAFARAVIAADREKNK